jgi:3-isopropylmalate dehydrogenase
MILSVSMMFRYSFDLEKEAQIIDDAVGRTLEKGIFTGDIGGKSSTSEVGDAILQEILALSKE